MKLLAIDPSRCTGCRTCELVCSLVKEGRFDRRAARIHVVERPGATWCMPVTCLQCEDAPCEAACPGRAIQRNARTGALCVDATRCAGCMLCSLVCPVGAPAPGLPGDAMRKCDLCDGDPACARHCRNEALTTVTADADRRALRRRLRETLSTAVEARR